MKQRALHTTFDETQEKMAKEHGFSSWNEMCSLISSAPLMTEEDRKEFTQWKENDGSKKGLLEMINKAKARRRRR